MPGYTLEIAAFTLAGALTAQRAGADRIEFCENPFDGGTTPSYGTLKIAKKLLSIPIFPIIRPRAGDFLYTDEEFEAMCLDMILCRQLGYQGVVTGVLLADGNIDFKRTSQLVNLAYPMEVTFHRAFDRCVNPLESLEQVIDVGCQRILTSGQFPSALQGAGLIKLLVEKADDRIIIMPGSGVRSENVAELAGITGAKEFHSSARTAMPTKMNFEVVSMQEELTYMDVDFEEVTQTRHELGQLSKSG